MGRSFASIGTEVLIVVGGILIAFALDAWWDRRQTAEWERNELRALHEEFSANLTEFQSIGAIHRDHAEGVFTIARSLTETTESALQVSDSLLVDLFWWRTSDPTTGVLDALLASGQVVAIRSADLRRRLSEWPTALADGLEDELIARDFVEHTLAPRLAGHGVVTTGYAVQLSAYYPPASQLRGGAALPVNDEVRDLIAQRLRHLLWSAANAEALQIEIQQLLAVIERELEQR